MKKPISVVKETSTSVRVLRRFRTVREAEQYIATTLTKRDSKGVYDGVYGIDAPEPVAEIKIATKKVAVTKDLGNGTALTMYRTDTVAKAEAYITRLERIDPEGVHAGVYGIDAPEPEEPDYGAKGQPGQIEFNGVQQVLRKADLEMILSGLEILEPDSHIGERRRQRLEAIFQAYTD